MSTSSAQTGVVRSMGKGLVFQKVRAELEPRFPSCPSPQDRPEPLVRDMG